MIILASSSPTRAKILKDNNVDFKQVVMNFNEENIDKNNPFTYAYKVALSKKEQFFKNYNNKYDNVLFADSCVVVNNQIFGKAKNNEEAKNMLLQQSGNYTSIITAMIFQSNKFEFSNLSITTYKFKNFDEFDLENYIKNQEYKGKAGAMSIESFNKKYIISQKGNTSTAMGLNIEILKAYLW